MTNYTITAAKGTYLQTGGIHDAIMRKSDKELVRANTDHLTDFSPINQAEKGLSSATVTKEVRWWRDHRW